MPKRKEDFYKEPKQPVETEKQAKTGPARYPTVFDYLRFGESYTSLLLGIIVVIIAGMLFVSFVKKHNAPQMKQETSSTSTIAKANLTPTVLPSSPLTVTPTSAPTATPMPTATPTPKPTNTPTPTLRPSLTPTPTRTAPTPTKTVVKATPTPTKIAKPTVTPTPTVGVQVAQKISGSTYVTQKGDDLWSIAVKAYGNGYMWTKIAQENKLENPNILYSGTKLTLPKITPTPVVAQKSPTPTTQVATGNTIKGHTYTVVKGDDLWDIAVRAYGDGYQWVKIAQANHLSNPSVIFSGNVLSIP
jgi:nucleoid-associated protein YgaU